MTTVERCAVKWWESIRPCGWSVNDHLKNPCVNTTTGTEILLATAVAELVTIIA